MRTASRLTIELIAQPAQVLELKGRDRLTDAPSAGREMGFDFMPVARDGRLVGIAPLRALKQMPRPSTNDVQAVMKQIDVNQIVALDTPILDLLPRLRRAKFMLCLGRDGVRQVVTHWDLAQPTASHLAFGLALVVEGETADAIDAVLTTDRAISQALRRTEAGALLTGDATAWQQRREKMEQIQFGRSISFGAKLQLLPRLPRAVTHLRKQSKLRWRDVPDETIFSELHEIRGLRNAIGHDQVARLRPDHVARLILLTYEVADDLAAA
jgi:hypothetical protein